MLANGVGPWRVTNSELHVSLGVSYIYIDICIRITYKYIHIYIERESTVQPNLESIRFDVNGPELRLAMLRCSAKSGKQEIGIVGFRISSFGMVLNPLKCLQGLVYVYIIHTYI